MRKMMFAATAALILALVAAPALAGYLVLRDDFNPKTGTGVAIVHVRGAVYAEIGYKDMDRSASFTDPDTQLWARYFQRGQEPLRLTIPVGL